ncbi:MAG: ABC transporter permease [Gemmatimonadales bacterium]
MDSITQDLHHALRRLRRSPRFAVAAALTLAIGVGGASGIFALVDAVLLRPLPYPDPDRLVAVMHSAPGLGLSEAGHSYGTYHHYRDNSRMLQDFAVYHEGVVELSGGGEPERVRVAVVTPSFFSTLGVAPAKGRPFGPADGSPGAPSVVILGHDLWTRRYGADPGIVGRTVDLNRAPSEVVGVMPRGFGFPRPETEVWWASDFPAMRGAWLSQLSLSGLARLTSSASPESAERELNGLVPTLAVTPSGAQEVEDAGLAVHVESLHDATVGDLANVLWFILAAMVLVLAIAGANVASLFLVRAEERRVEMTVRAALGAGSAERVRLFLMEGVVLGAIAGVLAVPLAAWLVEGVKAFGPTDLPRMHEVGFGMRYAMLTLGIALFLGAILSAAPVLRRVLRGDGTPTLRVEQRAATGPAQRRTMHLLTVSQIAIGFALLVGAALLLQSFWRLRNVDPGFDAENVLTLQIAHPRRAYRREAAEARLWHALLARIQGLPGVTQAGGTVALPLTPGDYEDEFLRVPFDVEGASLSAERRAVVAFVNVTPGYFETLRIPTISGDVPTSWSPPSHSVVVNAAFARRFLAGQDPLDARVRPMRAWPPNEPWHNVTAVVGDVRDEGLAADPTPIVYVPVSESSGEREFWNGNMSLAIRTSVPPLSLTGAVRAVVRDIDPYLPIAWVRTMEDIVANATAPERFMTLALSLAAMIALFLSAVGTYGLVAYAVSRRTHELGVRIALGASGARIRQLVLRQGAVLALAGVAMGLAAAVAFGGILKSLLYEVDASDPATLAAASLFLFAVVLLAIDVPARRAARVDPMVALRTE